MLLFAGGVGILQWFSPKAEIKGAMDAADVARIEDEVRRLRLGTIRESVMKGNYRLFLGLCLPEFSSKGREVGFIDAREPESADETPRSNGPHRVYYLSGRYRYELARTTNGWEVFSFGIR